jgi:hypothetical protein
MRGLEITLFLLCIVFALPLVALLVPGYNNGGGIATGAQDFNGQQAFNWSSLDKYNATNKNQTILDQASYWFDFARLAITGIASILFAAVWAAPSLLAIFGINPVLAGVLLSVLAIALILAWLQIIKGDDWSGRR